MPPGGDRQGLPGPVVRNPGEALGLRPQRPPQARVAGSRADPIPLGRAMQPPRTPGTEVISGKGRRVGGRPQQRQRSHRSRLAQYMIGDGGKTLAHGTAPHPGPGCLQVRRGPARMRADGQHVRSRGRGPALQLVHEQQVRELGPAVRQPLVVSSMRSAVVGGTLHPPSQCTQLPTTTTRVDSPARSRGSSRPVRAKWPR